ncbi:hypothetical protein I7I48_07131 [Histoplasma ohiense]|nr:hypothetical protein I7I48_07131 [Histoplasma ohiense (nom. inval.)]
MRALRYCVEEYRDMRGDTRRNTSRDTRRDPERRLAGTLEIRSRRGQTRPGSGDTKRPKNPPSQARSD